MKRIAVFTSGGDAPGMNAAIRAVVRAGIYYGCEVIGIKRGYKGMIDGELEVMTLRSVSNVLQKGGTILKTSRSEEFRTPEGMAKAARILEKEKIDGIVAIGGNGTITGLLAFREHWKGKMLALPGTIDNDLYGTDYTIGFHTAVQTAMEVVDKIKDTAASHERVFLIEVMGRESGFIALDVGIGGGAEEILIPENDANLKESMEKVLTGMLGGKTSSIIIIAEGSPLGGAHEVAAKAMAISKVDCRVVVIGHIQRGGSPVFYDRVLSSKLGVYAVEEILKGADNAMAGEIDNRCVLTPLEDTVKKKKPIDPFKVQVASILAI